jgi:hypothetical protein
MKNRSKLANLFRSSVISAIFLVLPCTMPDSLAADQPKSPFTQIPIGPAYANDAVNTSIFRVSALLSAGNSQFVAYYAPDGSVVVGQRTLPDGKWDLATQPFKGKVSDSHNVVSLGISSDGLLHLAYDHHDNPLRYRVSQKPYDIRSFGPLQPMTGHDETSVTYPQFLSAPDGTLYFFYRDGASGNGSLCFNRYDAATKTWIAIQHPLIDGEHKRNPYWWRPSISPDGTIYLAWCWRDTPNAATNHDLCFARSKDQGAAWQHSDGHPQQLPITLENAEVIDPIPTGSNLINQCSSAVDAQGNCHLAEYFNDDDQIPQYFDEWFDGSHWHKSQVSQRTLKFSFSGGGTLKIPIRRPEIAVSATGTAYIITRDAEFGNGIRIYHAAAPYTDWQATDVTHEDLGNWEPDYDLTRFHDAGVISLFVLPVKQGNHEQTTNFGAQIATVVEVPAK